MPIYANYSGVKHSLLKDTIIKLFKQGHSRNLKTLIEKIHPADLALILPEIDAESKKALFEYYVTDKQAAKIISRLRDKKNISDVLSGLRRHRICEIFKHIEPDDAAYLLSMISVEEAEALLKLMKKDDADEANKVLRFSQGTAGGIMSTFFIYVKMDSSIEQCIKELKKSKEKNDSHYIYITDADGILKGTIKIKDIFRWSSETKVTEIMDDNPVYLLWDARHSEVVDAAHRYGVPEIPVVNRGRRLIGVISAEHIFKTAKKEIASRTLISSGLIDLKEPEKIRTLNSMKIKLPIMIYAITIGFLAVTGIDYYLKNDGIHSSIIGFIPLVLLVSYIISNSSASTILRELFFERINAANSSSFKDIMVELRSALFYGMLVSAIAASYSIYISGKDLRITVICSVGILLSYLSASFVGTFISVFMVRAGLRPTRVPLTLVVCTAVAAALIVYLWSVNGLYYTKIIPVAWKTLKF
jgi:magnesium transporter